MLHVSFNEDTPENTGCQGDGGDNEICRGTEVLGIASAKGSCADREERKTDGSDYGCGHYGRNDFFPVFGEKSEDSFKDTADQNGTDYGRIAELSADCGENGDEGEADAHDNREL